MKSKVVVFLAVLISLAFTAPSANHVDHPITIAIGQNGGA
jgi:hypothetical protein